MKPVSTTHVALHATEVVATERFRYCRVVHSGGQAAVLGQLEVLPGRPEVEVP